MKLLITSTKATDTLHHSVEVALSLVASSREATLRAVHPEAEQVAKFATQGALVPEVSLNFSLAEAAEAHRASVNGDGTGKIVLVSQHHRYVPPSGHSNFFVLDVLTNVLG